MDIAVFAYVGPVTPLVQACIASLKWWSGCKIIFYGEVDKPDELGCEIQPLPRDWTNHRMTERMWMVSEIGDPGDHVMLFDTDLLFLSNPFRAFDAEFDMCYTTRPVPNPKSPVNGGVTGFRAGPVATKLWRFMLFEARRPSWSPYLAVRRRLERYKSRVQELDWWTHQDLLCAMHERKLPSEFTAKLHDLGPRYNWCPDSGGGRPLSDADRASFIQDYRGKDIVVVHFKELKHAVQPGDLVFQRSPSAVGA